MLKFSLIFLAFIALFVLLLRGAVILMGRITGKYVGEKHKGAEIIINTGMPPKNWIYSTEKKIAKLEKDTVKPDKILKIQRKTKNACLKKLERLIKYFKTSPLVKDEETRKILLDELAKVHRAWKEEDWEEILTSEPATSSVRT